MVLGLDYLFTNIIADVPKPSATFVRRVAFLIKLI